MNDLKFTKTHEWLHLENNEVTVGITEHAQELLGDMVFIEMPQVGEHVTLGDELGVVESVKAASDFYAPVSGIVTAVNEAAVNSPELVNKSPYSSGWLVKMTPTNLSELEQLLNAEQYKLEIAEDN
mgnify:CR=1 FL=1